MKKALVIGGTSGLGLAIVNNLLKNGYEHVYAVGLETPKEISSELNNYISIKALEFIETNLFTEELERFQHISDINTLIITAGFGRVSQFDSLTEFEISKLITVNETIPIKIIKHFYNLIKSKNDFYTAVIGSIAGHIASPMFSIYGAAKAGLCSFVKSINCELAACGYENRILDVSPGSFKGSSFNGGVTDLSCLNDLANKVLCKMFNRELLFIPDYDEVYAGVIAREREDYLKFGIDSFEYKQNRVTTNPQIVIGYLTGTFDLFHIGHLNLLKRAKSQCDYLIVGVHESGSWKGKETFIPFEERLAIVEGIRYVDKVEKSLGEDSAAWEKHHYHKLFVGSDYLGSERFKRYEKYFKDKGVKIVYFPYTKGTSSTQLREKLKK